MRILITEDNIVSRNMMQKLFSYYGQVDMAIEGKEALDAYKKAWDDENPYVLICLDIMMPEVDGHEVLHEIREFESDRGILPGTKKSVKILMTTAVDDRDDICNAFSEGCEGYILKPVTKEKIIEELEKLSLLGVS